MNDLMSRRSADLAQAAVRFASQIGPDHFIDGTTTQGTGDTLPLTYPGTGSSHGEIAIGTPADVDVAVASARAAFADGRWARRTARDRGRTLTRLADLIEEHREELALLETLDMGKPVRDAYHGDIVKSANLIRWYGEAIDKQYAEVAPTEPAVHAFTRRVPLGVVACITPWNFPLYQAAYKIGPALAAGNCLILKPSELAPRSTRRVAELAMQAGLPEGVLNVVTGNGQVTGAALASHPGVDAVAFTGSAATAQLVAASAARSLAKLSIEAGGKSAHLVLPEVAQDPSLMATVADSVVDGFCYNQGQVCSAGSRLVVHEDTADELVERIMAATQKYALGDPFDPSTSLGPVVSRAQLTRINSYFEQAVIEGGDPVLADDGSRHPDQEGNWVTPMVVDRVAPDSTLAQEEVFGPVLAVIRYRDVGEAIGIVNNTQYGLGAAVWSRDIDRALGAAMELRAGQVWVNNYDGADFTVPWGGFKRSGQGRDKSLEAINEYTGSTTTWIQLDLGRTEAS